MGRERNECVQDSLQTPLYEVPRYYALQFCSAQPEKKWGCLALADGGWLMPG